MIITALVLREWSKVEVPATPTSQTRWCVPHLFEVNFGPPGLLDDPYLTLLTFQDFWQPYRPKLSPAKPQPPDTTELDQVRSAWLYE